MIRHIPNMLTALNLFCGCSAIVAILAGESYWVPVLLCISVLADFMDGLAARLLNVSAEMGKELDSLADMVSFGVVPGTMFYVLLLDYFKTGEELFHFYALPAFLLTVFAGWRLALFNVDTRQTKDFIGLNTPTCTMFVLGSYMVFQTNFWGLQSYAGHPVFIGISILVLSWLMVADIRLFGNKVENFGWKGNEVRYIFFIAGVANLFLLGWLAFPVNVILYIILSLLNNASKKA